jgi:hypothetical protein
VLAAVDDDENLLLAQTGGDGGEDIAFDGGPKAQTRGERGGDRFIDRDRS